MALSRQIKKALFFPSNDIEEATQRSGKELFQQAHRQSRNLSPLNLWTQSLFQWSLKDVQLKSHLLRFVDAFPALKTDREVVSHIRQYLNDHRLRMPAVLKAGVIFSTRVPLTGRAVSALTRTMITQVARQFICGETPEEAFETIRRLEKQGMGFTLDLLGEATLTDREARACRDRYLTLLKDIAARCLREKASLPLYEATPRLNLSVKLSALCARFDPIHPKETTTEVIANLLPILKEAVALKAFINIDMESYEYRDLTLEILKSALKEPPVRGYPHLGVVFQAYLKDSEETLANFLSWLQREHQPMTIRLVKGAYWDYEVAHARAEGWPVPVFLNKSESDAHFERLTGLLLRAPEDIRVAIASHNVRSLARALAEAETLQIPKNRLEFQMLYGMADAVKKALASMGWPVRVYVPYGEMIPGMAYLVRRLLENTANESFLKHDFLHENSEEELLRAPGVASSKPPPPKKENDTFINEPLLDFSKPATTDEMKKTLQRVQAQLGKDHTWSLAGTVVHSRQTLTRPNPAHRSEWIGRINKATIEHVQTAVLEARRAQSAWGRKPAAHRAKLLRAAAGILHLRRLEIAAWEVYEAGKNWREADADVAEAIDYLYFYAAEAVRLENRPELISPPGERNRLTYKPLGVGAVIAPWNFPAAILTGMTAAALATGNAVIVKPSEQSTFTAMKIIEILHAAGIPKNILLPMPGEGSSVGAALVDHPEISFVAFTGSREVGLKIIRNAAEIKPGQKHLKRVIAEMGGKNAIIVDEDADLDEAVKGVVASAFGYGGQKCSACSRVIVPKNIYSLFTERLVEAVKSLVVAPPEEARCMMGPLIDETAVNKVRRYISLGLQGGAKLLYQGDVSGLSKEGCYVGPTIFGEVKPDSRIAQEEIFGPVLCVLKTENFEEALSIANDSQYALTGGIYSRSPDRIALAEAEFNVGNLYINRKITGARIGQQPFGGHKLSGYGTKAGGPDYLLQFVTPHTLTENNLRHGFPLQD